MYPSLFELGGFTVYTYGVLLAAAYLLGLQLALVRARARGLDAQRVIDLGIYIIISALVGAKLLLLVVDFQQFTGNPRELLDARAVRRRVLRRPDRSPSPSRSGTSGGIGLPLWTTTRCVRAGHRARPRRRPLRLPVRRLLLRQADDGAVGDHVSRPVRGGQRRHAARRAAAPDAALRSGRRAADPRACCWRPSDAAAPFPGRTFWLYMLLYGVSRFIIEFYRGDNRGHRSSACSRPRSSSRSSSCRSRS